MDNNALKQILRKYDSKRTLAIQEMEKRKAELLKINPILSEIETKISQLSLEMSKAMLQSSESERKKLLSDYKKTLSELVKEKNKFIKDLTLDSNYLKPNFECKHCQDTGYIEKNGTSVMCNCLKQNLFDVYYNKSNIGNLKRENFSKFNVKLFSEEKNFEKYKSKISPRENIELIKEISVNFIDEFDNPEEKNLLFTGNTGLGKTFMINCIANECLNQNKTVLYQTAPVMFDEIINAKFGKENSNFDLMNNILSSDLLIIDDLGAEHTNDLYITELFTILNTRLLNQNNRITKTIISTNLRPEELEKIYTTRISSRIVGNYRILRFFGEDLRFKKKQKNIT